MIRVKLRRVAVTSALLLTAMAAASFSARADIINGGFESASLAGWQSIGEANVVTGSFGTGPAGGTYQALIEGGINSVSTADLAAFLEISAGSLNALGNGITHSGSAIAQTFTATAGEVLTLDWNFITDEARPSVFNDFAFWSLNSSLTSLATANGSALSAVWSCLANRPTKIVAGFTINGNLHACVRCRKR